MSNISIVNISEHEQKQIQEQHILDENMIPVIIEQGEVPLTPGQDEQLTKTDVMKILLLLMLGIFGFLFILGILATIAGAIIIMHKLEL